MMESPGICSRHTWKACFDRYAN